MFCSTLVYATKGAPSECQQHWPEYGGGGGRDLYCLTDCDTYNLPMCKYDGKVVPIKLIENLSPIVHLHSKQRRKANKELL